MVSIRRSQADREGSRFALMFMDLDGFKAVNDAYGHNTGDQLLIAVTERSRAIKGQFTLARIAAMSLSCLRKPISPTTRGARQRAGARD
ncbi:diguanylate cyclase domain-containing protein [Cronobacter sakazakii]|uniref:diguanylate cyclase domain-containing protein n=1 Tax=Cronobacter sakazakii TaxID=28141 RepID=UPI0035161938